jgi:hypothetical protein
MGQRPSVFDMVFVFVILLTGAMAGTLVTLFW